MAVLSELQMIRAELALSLAVLSELQMIRAVLALSLAVLSELQMIRAELALSLAVLSELQMIRAVLALSLRVNFVHLNSCFTTAPGSKIPGQPVYPCALRKDQHAASLPDLVDFYFFSTIIFYSYQ